MEILIRNIEDVALVSLIGKVLLDSHAELRQAFRHVVDCGRQRIVVNLTRAKALDSLMLAALVAGVKRAREHGGDVKLVVVPDSLVHELLQLTGLDRMLQIYGDEHQATAAFATGTD